MTRYLHKNYLACLPLQGQEVGNWIYLTLTLDFLTTDLLSRLARINFDSPLRKKSFRGFRPGLWFSVWYSLPRAACSWTLGGPLAAHSLPTEALCRAAGGGNRQGWRLGGRTRSSGESYWRNQTRLQCDSGESSGHVLLWEVGPPRSWGSCCCGEEAADSEAGGEEKKGEGGLLPGTHGQQCFQSGEGLCTLYTDLTNKFSDPSSILMWTDMYICQICDSVEFS